METRHKGTMGVEGDGGNGSVGTIPPFQAIQLVVVLILSVLDAFFTLLFVEKGAWEANPVMRSALEQGPSFFVSTKYALTAAGFLFLFRNGHVSLFRGRITLAEITGGLILFYKGLVIYELKVFSILF